MIVVLFIYSWCSYVTRTPHTCRGKYLSPKTLLRIPIFSLCHTYNRQTAWHWGTSIRTIRLTWRSFCYCSMGLLTCCPFNQTCIRFWSDMHHWLKHKKRFSRQMRNGSLSVKIKWITVRCRFPTNTLNELKDFPTEKKCSSRFTQSRRYWHHILNQLGFLSGIEILDRVLRGYFPFLSDVTHGVLC